MPSKLVKANQDKESDLPRVSICPLFQVPSYEHTHTGTHTQTETHTHKNTHTQTHTGTHAHRNTHRNSHIGTRTQEHTHTGTHTQEHTHTKEHTHTGTLIQEHTHIWMGQGGHHRGARGAGSGALMVCQGFTTCTATRTRGCSSTPSSSSATLWGKGASAGSGGGEGCILTRGGTKLRPTVRASVPAPWNLPSRVGWGQHWFLQCSHWALALASTSPSYQLKSCQQALGRGDL